MLEAAVMGAVGVVVGGVAQGATGEVGKTLAISFGAWVRRVLGREVQAPATQAEQTALLRSLTAALSVRPELAAQLDQFRTGRAELSTARPGLPAPARHFEDRKAALKALDAESARPFDGTPRIAVVHGPEGMGTSELPRRWGAERRERYPDGLLYVDLRGRSPVRGLSAAAASAQLLAQLGLARDEMPAGAEGRCDLLRALLAEREALVVLDHAHSAPQVLPLITAAAGVFTVVVATHPPAGLDAVRIPVGPLPGRDARKLFEALVDEQAAARLGKELRRELERCGGSPFAVRALAARVSCGAPSSAEGDAVSAAAEAGHRLLGPDEARIHRLLALRPWPSFGATAAARAADLPEADAERALARLHALHLVEPAGPDRFRHRPAVRAHAARTVEPGEEGPALRRMVDGYTDFARAAAHAALPLSWRVPRPRAAGRTFPGEGAALEALAGELPNLVEAVYAAEDLGDVDAVVGLCRSFWPLQLKAGHHDTVLDALRTGVRVAGAQATGDTDAAGGRDLAALHLQLALSLTELRRWQEAEPEAEAAARAEREAGHVRGEASAVEFLGLLRLRQWRFAEALECFQSAGRVLDGIGPGDEGAADLPRARALLARHQGRALGGLGRHGEGAARLEQALAGSAALGDAYNEARARTDLAEILIASGDCAAALPHLDAALGTLRSEGATQHVQWLERLRARASAGEGDAGDAHGM
ncbi:tetratricopeptide repeat protein [Streptomyces indicus]|uniref:tetratricopeptide repeat protein n=1 Tax=Streptomyces indicus TaxID=417292 RepID=UPI00115FA0EF|nr:tetratricopeptide repeat protein [Streptomyces indicus]